MTALGKKRKPGERAAVATAARKQGKQHAKQLTKTAFRAEIKRSRDQKAGKKSIQRLSKAQRRYRAGKDRRSPMGIKRRQAIKRVIRGRF